MPRQRAARAPVKRVGRPRVAVLAPYLGDEYEWTVWRGVRRAVEARGGSAVCIAGAARGDPLPERSARGPLYELVAPGAFDGIVCISSVVGHFVGVNATETWLSTRGIPAVAVGHGERLPHVLVDAATGMNQLLHHLIAHHQHRRIAFISGPPTSPEAGARSAAYERTLQKHELAVDRRLMLEGDFTQASGARAVVELFDRRQLRSGDVDAIVAANDDMALGAIDELSRRRIGVPDQLAVVGFDDITHAHTLHPSLTTVRQPIERLGREAAEQLLATLGGHSIETRRVLETELVLRRSCGCVPTDVPAPLENPSELEDVTIPGRAQLGAKLETALAAELYGAPGAFARALEPYLRHAAAGDTQRLERGRRFAEDLAARVRFARDDLVHERLNRLGHALHSRIFGPQALLSTALAELLPGLGLDECAVSEFVPAEPQAPGDRTLKLAFGFDGTTLQPQMATFDARELAPLRFEHLNARSAVVLPLTSGAELLGVAVMPATDRDGAFYEMLAELFGSVLKVLDLRRKAPR